VLRDPSFGGANRITRNSTARALYRRLRNE
jgi:hypothetical protein